VPSGQCSYHQGTKATDLFGSGGLHRKAETSFCKRCVGQGPGLVQLRHHLQGPLEGESEQQWPKGVTLTHPTLGEDHRLSPLQQLCRPYAHATMRNRVGQRCWTAASIRSLRKVLKVFCQSTCMVTQPRSATMPARRTWPVIWLPPDTPTATCSGARLRPASGIIIFPQTRPARHRKSPQPHLLINARASLPGSPSARTTPQRRVRSCSYLAPL
jgi:hypothetical protein